MKSKNKNLHAAKSAKNDEFYTQLSDIERELIHYKEQFKDKVVLCNCDDPRGSNFFNYFFMNFRFLGLKKLIATCYKNQDWNLFSEGECEKAVYIVYDGPKTDGDDGHMPKDEDITVRELEGDGDFRSAECRAFLELADIVVTNPPFSLFREFVSLMMEYGKKFLIIGHQNAITYKEVFPLFIEKKLWLGYGFTGGAAHFISNYEDTAASGNHKEGMIRVSGVHWFTNLENDNKKEPVVLTERYDPERYPKYDNYDAINVDKTCNIPVDYYGVVGVPITFLDKWNPNAPVSDDGIVTTNDFEIVQFRNDDDGKILVYTEREKDSAVFRNTRSSTSIPGMIKNAEGKINGKATYARILIRRRQS